MSHPANPSRGRKLLVATGNPGKVQSLRRFLQDVPFALSGLEALREYEPVEETGSTFEANARLKAEGYARQFGWLTLADDSGLAVDALNGEPGVFSARYGGPGLNDTQRCELLLRNLRQVPEHRRGAQFVCVVAVAEPEGECQLFRGVRRGSIADRLRGDEGFGYDPVFIPEGSRHTYAEVSPASKDEISHRALAMEAAVRHLMQVLNQDT